MIKNKENITLFFTALISSLFIWAIVANMKNPITTKTFSDVTIEMKNVTDIANLGLSIESKSLPTATIVVKGRFTDLQAFSAENIHASINFKDMPVKEGANIFVVDTTINNPKIKVYAEKSTGRIELSLKQLVNKDIPVSIQVVGNPKEGYIVLEADFNTKSISCSGTQDDIDSIKQLVGTIDVSNLSSDCKTLVNLKAVNKYNDEIKSIVISQKEIGVTLPIKFKKEVPIELAISKQPEDGLVLSSHQFEHSKVTIIGSKEILDKISSIKTEEIDLSRRYYDFEKNIYLKFPPNVSPLNPEENSIYTSFTFKSTQ